MHPMRKWRVNKVFFRGKRRHLIWPLAKEEKEKTKKYFYVSCCSFLFPANGMQFFQGTGGKGRQIREYGPILSEERSKKRIIWWVQQTLSFPQFSRDARMYPRQETKKGEVNGNMRRMHLDEEEECYLSSCGKGGVLSPGKIRKIERNPETLTLPNFDTSRPVRRGGGSKI